MHRGAELLRVCRVIGKHIVVAGNGYPRFDVARQIRGFPMRQIVEAAVDAGDHQVGGVAGCFVE